MCHLLDWYVDTDALGGTSCPIFGVVQEEWKLAELNLQNRCENLKISQSCVRQSRWRTQEFCSKGVQQIQLGTEDRENGDLGAVAP